MSRYLSCAWVRPPGAGLGVSDGAGVGLGGIVPRSGTMVPVIAVAVTVPAGVVVAVTAVALAVEALGSGVVRSDAAPPHPATRATPSTSTTARMCYERRGAPDGSRSRCPGRRRRT